MEQCNFLENVLNEVNLIKQNSHNIVMEILSHSIPHTGVRMNGMTLFGIKFPFQTSDSRDNV